MPSYNGIFAAYRLCTARRVNMLPQPRWSKWKLSWKNESDEVNNLYTIDNICIQLIVNLSGQYDFELVEVSLLLEVTRKIKSYHLMREVLHLEVMSTATDQGSMLGAAKDPHTCKMACCNFDWSWAHGISISDMVTSPTSVAVLDVNPQHRVVEPRTGDLLQILAVRRGTDGHPLGSCGAQCMILAKPFINDGCSVCIIWKTC